MRKAFVWVEDVAALPYVRELTLAATSHRRSLRRYAPGRCPGWTVLAADAEPSAGGGMWLRRLFWLREGEDSDYGDGFRPAEGVAPAELVLGRAEHGVGCL